MCRFNHINLNDCSNTYNSPVSGCVFSALLARLSFTKYCLNAEMVGTAYLFNYFSLDISLVLPAYHPRSILIPQSGPHMVLYMKQI